MFKFLSLCFGITLIVSSMAYAGKLYKIVDAEGNITFSQFPPAPSEQSKNLEVKTEDVGGNPATKVTTKGVTDFCGEIRLPTKSSYSDRYYSQIKSKLKQWESNLERQEQYLEREKARYSQRISNQNKYRYGSSNNTSSDFLKRNQERVDDIKDLRCAVNWAKGKDEESVMAAKGMSEELDRLSESLANMTLQRSSQCGQEPTYAPDSYDNRQEISVWKKCSRQFDSDIRQLERMIRNESRKLEQM